jgi:hypothetical protein
MVHGRSKGNFDQPTDSHCPVVGRLPMLKVLMIERLSRRAVIRRVAAAGLASLLQAGVSAAPANAWNKIRYQGGSIEAKVNPFDWNTTLTLRPGEVDLLFAGRKRVIVPVADITNISYGQKAYRRVADMALLSVLATPVALFGLLRKSKDHIVGIEYKTPDGKTGAILLTVHKDSYQDLLRALKATTGKAIDNWP